MEIATRQASETDYEWLYELKVASMRDYIEELYGWDDVAQRAFFDEGFRPCDIEVIIFEGSNAGMFELSQDDEGFFLRRIEVHPRFQGRGVGSRIIEEVIRRATEMNEPVRLQVFKGNPARNLYQRFGFEVVTETATHYQMLLNVAKLQKEDQRSESDG